MSGARIGIADDLQERELVGTWFVEESPSEGRIGKLSIRVGQSLELTVFGGFPDAPRGSRRKIHGTAGGRHITLMDAYLASESHQGATITEQRWSSFEGFDGRSFFEGGETATFDYVSIETHGLEDWLTPPTHEMLDHEESLISISLRLPAALKFSIRDRMDVEIGWNRGGERVGRRDAAIDITPSVVVRLHNPATLEEIWRDVVAPVLYFVVLSTGGPDRIRRISIGQTSGVPGSHSSYFEWLGYGWRGAKPKPAAVYWGEHFIPFTAFRERIPFLFDCWLDLYEIASFPLHEFFAGDVLENRAVFDEEFSRAVRQLEVYHRITAGGMYMAEDAFQDLVLRLKGAARTPEERNFISMRMGFANELTLKQRLEALIANSCGLLEMEVRSRPRFVRRVVATRNSITHESSLGEAFSIPDMAEAMAILRRIMRANILRDIGFSEEDVHAALVRSPDYARGGVNYHF